MKEIPTYRIKRAADGRFALFVTDGNKPEALVGSYESEELADAAGRRMGATRQPEIHIDGEVRNPLDRKVDGL